MAAAPIVDADPVGRSLTETASQIAQMMRFDAMPPLDMSGATGRQAYFPIQGAYQYFHDEDNLFETKSCRELPARISRSISDAEPTAVIRAGLLPEINRAYFTIDSKLWLWNYAEADDILLFEDCTTPIIAVAHCPAKRQVFSAEVHSLLAISTATEVLLLAVVFPVADIADATPTVLRPLELIPTHYKVGTGAAMIDCMRATRAGRLFMGGSDGGIYEFEYEPAKHPESPYAASSGLLPCVHRRKARKTDISSGLVYQYFGSLFSWMVPACKGPHRSLFGSASPIRQVVIDEADPRASRVLTLDQSGSVWIYDIGAQGDTGRAGLQLLGHEIHAEAKLNGLLGDEIDPLQGDWIAAISAVPRTDKPWGVVAAVVGVGTVSAATDERLLSVLGAPSDERLLAVLTTQRGHRIFLGRFNSTYRVVAVRKAPPAMSLPAADGAGAQAARAGVAPAWSAATSPQLVRRVYSAGGVLLLCDAASNRVCAVTRMARSIEGGLNPTRPAAPASNALASSAAASAAATIVAPLIALNGTNQLHESVEELRLLMPAQPPPAIDKLSVLDVAEVPSVFLSNAVAATLYDRQKGDGATRRCRLPLDGLTELATQHALPRRQFLVLTPFGLTKLVKRRPIDELVASLLRAQGDRFVYRYGYADAFAMCMTVCAWPPAGDAQPWTDPVPPLAPSERERVARDALALLFREHAIEIELAQSHPGDTVRWSETLFPHRLAALKMFVARLLRPLLLQPLLKQRVMVGGSTATLAEDKYFLAFNAAQLQALDAQLTSALEFLRAHGDDFVPTRVRTKEQRQRAEAQRHRHVPNRQPDAHMAEWQQKRAEVDAVHQLVQRCAEGVRLLKLLLEANEEMEVRPASSSSSSSSSSAVPTTLRPKPLSTLLDKALDKCELHAEKMPLSDAALQAAAAQVSAPHAPLPSSSAASTASSSASSRLNEFNAPVLVALPFLKSFEFHHLVAPSADVRKNIQTLLQRLVNAATGVYGTSFPAKVHTHAPSLYKAATLMQQNAAAELDKVKLSEVDAGSQAHLKKIEPAMDKYRQLLGELHCEATLLNDVAQKLVNAGAFAQALELCALRYVRLSPARLSDDEVARFKELNLPPPLSQHHGCPRVYYAVLKSMLSGVDVSLPADVAGGVPVLSVRITACAALQGEERAAQREAVFQRLTSHGAANAANAVWLRQAPFCKWFYRVLVDLGRHRQLYALNDASVVQFLRDDGETERLLEYFTSNGHMRDAAQLLYEQALRADCHIRHRIEALMDAQRHLASPARAAAPAGRELALEHGGGGGGFSSDLLTNVVDQLDIARVQLKVYEALRARTAPAADAAELEVLERGRLCTLVELHDMAARSKLWKQLLFCFAVAEDGASPREVEVCWKNVVRAAPRDALRAEFDYLRELYATNAALCPLHVIIDAVHALSVYRHQPALPIELCHDRLGAPLSALLAEYHTRFCVLRTQPDATVAAVVALLQRYADTRPAVPSAHATALLLQAQAYRGEFGPQLDRIRAQLG